MAEQQISGDAGPMASRPHMPGYGVPESDEGLVPWSHARERLEQARNYWLVTVRPDGRPHAVPLWGAWVDDAFYFEGGGAKARNLAANRAVVVHLESGDDVVIVEGIAEEIRRPERALFARIDAAFAARYDYRPSANLAGPDAEPYPEGGLYAVRPHVVLVWSQFPRDATRFRFGGA
jgi:hypothetical protein